MARTPRPKSLSGSRRGGIGVSRICTCACLIILCELADCLYSTLRRNGEGLRMTPCTCGGRNKNCVRCDGSGIEPRRFRGAHGKVREVAPRVGRAPSVGWMIRSKGGRRGPKPSMPPGSRVQCEVCGRFVRESGQVAHAEAKHHPALQPARKHELAAQPQAPAVSVAPRVKARRRSDASPDQSGA
jgi:hypothetical protein